MLKKTVNGKTTTFTFDGANQLVSSTVDGVTIRYTYDAAGRLVKEGNKTYRYGYLDKVMSVSDGKQKLTYDYHADGQIASANYGNGKTEEFLWDGLALVHRGGEHFINEPHVGGGNPVVSSKGVSYFNDMLGTTVGFKTNGKYSPAALSAFGENLSNHSPAPTYNSNFFTGKPYVEGLGHVFLMRNYRASLSKWQTADPMGYPDGWNQLAYCGNGVTGAVDLFGAKIAYVFTEWICQYDPTGMGGYPLLDVFTFMKDKWDKGKQVMDILGIKTFNDFYDKMNEVLDDKVKEKLDEILDNGFWFDELLRADVASGGFSAYECTPPTEAEIIRVIGSGHEIYSVTLEKIDPDIEVYGSVRFVSGCTFKWKVVYE